MYSSSSIERYDYDAYGEAFHYELDDPGSTVIRPKTDLLYAGEQWDADLGMQYLRARYYLPAQGIFNRLDPFFGNLKDPQSLHKYAYVHGDPVNGIDPSGLFTIAEFMSTFSIKSFLMASLRGGAVGVFINVATTILTLIPLLPFWYQLTQLAGDFRRTTVLGAAGVQGGPTFKALGDYTDIMADFTMDVIIGKIVDGAIGSALSVLLGALPPYFKGLKTGFALSWGAVTGGRALIRMIGLLDVYLQTISQALTLMGYPVCIRMNLLSFVPGTQSAVNYLQLIADVAYPASFVVEMRDALGMYNSGDIRGAHQQIDTVLQNRANAYGGMLSIQRNPCP